MSKLIVEVCRVEKIEDHPNAEKMKIATVKGWKTSVRFDPETGVCQFKEGDLCIYFPPDAVLPKVLYEDRLGIGKYLHELPKDETGVRPEGRRVVATRLRGLPSYGVITDIDSKWGDDPTWEVGTNLVEHFGITKYEPPPETVEGEADRPNVRFAKYTSIENFGNYPNAFTTDDEVVMTEKIHGKNCRVGLVLDTDEEGNSVWTWMAGSHDVRRKEFINVQHRFKIPELIEQGIITDFPTVCTIFEKDGRYWDVQDIIPPNEKSDEPVEKVHVFEVDKDGNDILKRSEYWEALTENMKAMIAAIRYAEYKEDKFSIIVYGEIFGAGVQDMTYGMNGRGFRVFDIAINNEYLDYDLKTSFCSNFDIEMVPVLYKGKFDLETLETLTNGPTTICDAEKISGKFKGREGIVVTPVKETHYCGILNGRKIVKSVSADYLARKGGTEFH